MESLPYIVGGAVVGGTALALGPGLVVGYLGFNAAGIAAGSTAASMMSAAGRQLRFANQSVQLD